MDYSAKVIRDTLEEIAEENKFSNYDVKIKPISSGGGNYTSQLFLATISNDSKQLNLFVKVINLGEKFRNQGSDNFFETETFVYTKLFKVYRQLEEKHNVPEEHKLEFPKFYGYNSTRGEEALILEDLSIQGYSVYDRFKSIDRPYAYKTITEMAKLHALSFGFAQEYAEEFETTLKNLKFSQMDKENMQKVMISGIESAYSVINEKNKDRFQNFFENLDFSFELTECAKPLRRTVLMHGDFRMSNLMYRVDDEGTYHLRILDYQTIRAGSPVVDLLYFILTGSDEEFRAKHYQPLIDHYYSELSLAMRRLGLKPDELYSREDFDFEIKMKLPHVFVIIVFLLPLLLVEEEDAPKINKEDDFTTFKIDKIGKLYPERINGIVNDFIRWGIL